MQPPPPGPVQPYGTQQPAQFAPPPVKQPGSASTKVWGVLLIVFGLYALMSLVGSVAMAMGTFSGASFIPASDPELKERLQEITQQATDLMLSRWTFWATMGSELLIAVVSLIAGFLLVVKPRPGGRKLAVARALLVLLFLPVFAYENVAVLDDQIVLQQEVMRATGDSGVGDDFATEFESIFRMMGYSGLVVYFIGIVVINALLLFFMTRPGVNDYLQSVAEGRGHAIPQFDPSMGIMYPPPQQPPPQQPPPQN